MVTALRTSNFSFHNLFLVVQNLTSQSGVPRFQDVYYFEKLPADVLFVPQLRLCQVVNEESRRLSVQLAEHM